MSDHQKLDQQIKDAFVKSFDSIEVPSEQEKWEEFESKYGDILFNDITNEQYLANLFEQKMDNEQDETGEFIQPGYKSNKVKTLSYYARVIVAASIIMTVIIFSMTQPQKASAIGDWVLNFFKIKTGDTTESIQRSQNMSEQQPGEITEIRTIEASLDEIQKISPYEVRLPSYLPANIQDRKLFYEEFSDLFYVTIEYFEGERKAVIFTQKNFFGDNELTLSYDTDDSENETILINGYMAHILEFKNNVNQIVWNDKHLMYELRGEIPLEELIRIAESIKKG